MAKEIERKFLVKGECVAIVRQRHHLTGKVTLTAPRNAPSGFGAYEVIE